MLRWLGHDAVAVLDGGFAAWTGEGRPVSTDAPAPRTARFVPQPRPEMALDTAGVERALARGEALVDVRGAERFAGVTEPIDAVAGHIPGAVNLPYTQNLDASGRFRRPRRARRALARSHGSRPGSRADLHVRLRRHRLPGTARSRGRRVWQAGVFTPVRGASGFATRRAPSRAA
jgi:thiosulfate/3-mercaptopyruvate sulfurtransferase